MADKEPTKTDEDAAGAIAALKREWSLAQKSWKTWTEDIVKKEYIKQFEATGFKSEANGAVVAANGLNAEVTGIKLEHTFLDPIQDMKDERERLRLSAAKQLPEQLRGDVDIAHRKAVSAMSVANQNANKLRETEVKVTALRREHTADLEMIAGEFEDVGNRVTRLVDALGGM
ncbi:hypothetical protein ABZX72_20060 [Streptomyces cyaneofuscatus]|uniref:hypothetical protein n=1 Tax=Streptomyces cyaneofuscatus TaxID=66883 RepID=UPI0033BBC2EB